MPKTKIQPEPLPIHTNVPDWILDVVARTIFEVGLTESLSALGRNDFDRDPDIEGEDWDSLPPKEKHKYEQMVWEVLMEGLGETEFINRLPPGETKAQRKIQERKICRDLSVLHRVTELMTTLRSEAITQGSRKS
jgi:hypothetical protein